MAENRNDDPTPTVPVAQGWVPPALTALTREAARLEMDFGLEAGMLERTLSPYLIEASMQAAEYDTFRRAGHRLGATEAEITRAWQKRQGRRVGFGEEVIE